MDERAREALVTDFVTALGYQLGQVQEVVIDIRSITVRGLEHDANGRPFVHDDKEVATFEHTYSLWTRLVEEAS